MQEAHRSTYLGRLLAAEHRQPFEDGLTQYLQTGTSPVVNACTTTTALHRSGRQFATSLNVAAIHTVNETAFCVYFRGAGEPGAQGGA